MCFFYKLQTCQLFLFCRSYSSFGGFRSKQEEQFLFLEISVMENLTVETTENYEKENQI